ncbi:ribonuclease-like [Emydura macquarii macquarii]|uniref:ribonuclease-like n=1 Tax=Emydura macquarii macquarii TaxID=1129001 RepID=UPI00352B36DF
MGRRIRARRGSAKAGIHRSDASEERRTRVDPATDSAMAKRGPHPALLLTLVLLAASLALSSGQSCVEKNKIFQKHHVDNPLLSILPTPYCNWMMRRREIYRKPLNTFINAPIPSINNVCSGGGTPSGNGLRRSKFRFHTISCRFNPRTRSYTGRGVSRRILIRCCIGLPVYYRERQ